jgi:putative membrane protein
MRWPFDPTVYAGLAGAWVVYLVFVRRYGARRRRQLFFGLGLATLWVALETPIDTISDDYLDSVHMLQHVLLGMVAPPLLLLGLTAPMAAAAARLPGLRAVTEPVPAQIVAGVVMIAWHFPVLYDATLRSEPLHVVEHLTFIGAGLVFWWPVVGITSQQAAWKMSPPVKLLYLLVGTIPQDAVALVLQFSGRPFYAFYVSAPRLIDTLDALTDQTIAGVVLMLLGKTSFIAAALVVLYRWAAGEEAREREEALPAAPR